MSRPDELITAQFAEWEQRARGWRVWPKPVKPEPPFEEFLGYSLSQPVEDDGRKPTFLSSIFDRIEKTLKPSPNAIFEELTEPEPAEAEVPLDCEFAVVLPAKLANNDAVFHAFVDSLAICCDPTCFELVATNTEIIFQFVASETDAPALRRQLKSFFSEVIFVERRDFVSNVWNDTDGIGFIVDFGLAHEFMLPLQTEHSVEPFVDLVGALSTLGTNESALFQVMFQPVRNSWGNSMWRSVTDTSGKNLFINKPQLITGIKSKVATPLFGVSVRAAAKAPEFDAAASILRNMGFALRAFTRHEGNRLIPLTNDEYPIEEREEDLLQRVSRRGGMLLNRDELLGFVHLPSDTVRSSKLRRQRVMEKASPPSMTQGVLLGFNICAGRKTEVRLTSEHRVRHTHIIGASGTGKSTLLLNLIQQDIEAGDGVGVLDPHGDLIDHIVARIPEHRIEDVVLFDSSDEEYPIGFNVLSAHSNLEKGLLASDLVSIFRRFSTSWGDQLNSVFGNAVNAFLESPRGGTLADLRRFLIDAQFREEFLSTVADPDVVFYWRKAFPQLGGNKSIGPVLTRLEMFLSRKPIRYMVSQKECRLDFATILNSRKIFLGKMAQGELGKENAFLLGSLIVSKFQQLAMARQNINPSERHDFWLYVDESHNFISPSMSEILTAARKYRLGLVLCHQQLHQLQRDADVASAVEGVGTRVVFRVGNTDAQALAKGFASFESEDLLNLENFHAVCRVERRDVDFNVSIPRPLDVDPTHASDVRSRIITRSREKFAVSRAVVEAALALSIETVVSEKRSAKRPAVPETVLPRENDPSPPLSVGTGPSTSVRTPQAPVQSLSDKVKKVVVPDLGRGGAQHQAVQRRIKEAAQSSGFRVETEEGVLDGKGSVDLVLKRADSMIACEISITTTVDHEVGNVVKCFRAGFRKIAMVTVDELHRNKIKAAVCASLGEEQSACVFYFSPDEFIASLQAELKPPREPHEPTIRRGLRVKRSYSASVSPEEAQQREETAIREIVKAIESAPKKSKRPGPS